MLRALPLLLVILGGCRTTTPGAPPPNAPWEVPLVFAADGHPVVQATVGGKPTLLILDTGARETTLQAWFVESLQREPVQVEGRRVIELPLELGAERLTAKWPLVETVPAERALGIGGTLSPQHARARGALALDFPRLRLVALDGNANAWLRWLDERSPKGQVEALPRVAPYDGSLHVLTRVGDGREVVTTVVTGQEHSSYSPGLFDSSLLVGGSHVPGLHLRLGQSEFGPLDILVQPMEGKAEGRLGLDVLRGGVLLVPVHELPPLWFMTPRE